MDIAMPDLSGFDATRRILQSNAKAKVIILTTVSYTHLDVYKRQALYKVLQGALANVVAHADAQRVKITLASGPDSVAMKIVDDGRGFNVGRKLGVARESYGLRAMRERVELLGGAIHFASRPARLRAECRGTTIEAQLPLQDSEIA